MNASRFMDKQIMDLSRSSMADNNNNSNSNNPDLLDLMNPQVDQQNHHHQGGINDGLLSMNKKKSEILPNYDFHPVNSIASSTVTRDWSSLDDSNLPNLSSNRSYGSPNHVQLDKTVLEKAQAKAQKVDESAILSEIDRTMKKHTDTLMHAIDSLSARLSQMESRTRQLEHSVDELKVSVGNAHGSADGKLRQLENIIMEVQSGVQNVKDKQDVIEGHMLLAKLQISKSEQSSKPANSVHQDPAPQAAAAAAASAPPQQSGFQQLATAVPQSYASLAPPNTPLPSQQNNHPPGPHRDAYFPTPDSSSQQYQIPPPVQNQQPGPAAPQPQPQLQPHQYQPSPAPPYSQPPHPPQQHPSIVGNSVPQYHQSSAPMGHRSDESPYVPPQTYPSNLYQPAAQPSGGPPPTQSYYGNTSPMYEPPPPARSSSSFPSSYAPPSGPSEQYPYGGPPSHYGGGPAVKPQPHSPRGGTGGYPQLPTARVLPSAIPTASGVSGGSSSGGGGNKVPIDDVVDRVTNMGFSRDQVRATVRRLTDNGQSVDLNVVLDKLMNDADVQPPKGWFGR